MQKPQQTAIIDPGRGPEVAGTRITVYDVMDFTRRHAAAAEIAAEFGLTLEQVAAATRYIEEHRAEVEAEYQTILERNARGNPPEIQALLDACCGLARRRMEELRAARRLREAAEGSRVGHPRGH